MGKPRLIIVIRHAQSEGNRNRSIHQTVPDHRVKLTPEGWTQAEEAGIRLRSMLHPDDTLQFYTSPYRRTRETTEGIVKSLTSDDPSPSPFPRHTIKVWEEPRLREQDFGNFQPDSQAMARMWKERAEYGHFFYRIPNGESAADAYDRVSGFNETLWRSFAEEDFPSVCVIVTHGLMTRVFLMKWFHWSVEYFEDLRNVNHCEFVVMERSDESGKMILKNEMRTWSELKRQKAAEEAKKNHQMEAEPRNKRNESSEGTTNEHDRTSKRTKHEDGLLPTEKDTANSKPPPSFKPEEDDEEAFPRISKPKTKDLLEKFSPPESQHRRPLPGWLEAGRDFGGSQSGAATPADTPGGRSDEREEYGFPKSGGGTDAPRHLELRTAGAPSGGAENLEKDKITKSDWLGDQDEDIEDNEIDEKTSKDR